MLMCGLLGMLVHVCWQCFILIILHIHWLVLNHPAFWRRLILCITYALKLLLAPSEPTSVLLPHAQNVIAILREKQVYFGRKNILF